MIDINAITKFAYNEAPQLSIAEHFAKDQRHLRLRQRD
jgi:hypothetical protein